jgi:hypothetical protein
MEAFNDAFLAAHEAKPQLLLQIQNAPEALFAVGKGPMLVVHHFTQGQQGNRGVPFTWDQISSTAPFPMYQIQGQMLHQHECFTRIEMGNAQTLTLMGVSQAFQADDGAQQALDLIDELPVDATRVAKAIFVPKYILAILPGCYTGHQLFEQLAEFCCSSWKHKLSSWHLCSSMDSALLLARMLGRAVTSFK